MNIFIDIVSLFNVYYVIVETLHFTSFSMDLCGTAQILDLWCSNIVNNRVGPMVQELLIHYIGSLLV